MVVNIKDFYLSNPPLHAWGDMRFTPAQVQQKYDLLLETLVIIFSEIFSLFLFVFYIDYLALLFFFLQIRKDLVVTHRFSYTNYFSLKKSK